MPVMRDVMIKIRGCASFGLAFEALGAGAFGALLATQGLDAGVRYAAVSLNALAPSPNAGNFVK
jgi:hypothetical protein